MGKHRMCEPHEHCHMHQAGRKVKCEVGTHHCRSKLLVTPLLQEGALLPLLSSLTFSACLLIPLVSRARLRVTQSPHGLAVGWTSLQPRPVSYVVCALLLPPSPEHARSPPSSVDSVHHGQSGLLTSLCLLCPFCFSLCDPKAAVPIPPFPSQSPGALRVWCFGPSF
jgi:hypothetical protein